MNSGRISTCAALVAAALCVSTTQVNAMTVNWANTSDAIALADGTTGVPQGDKVYLGIFKNNMSNTAITALWNNNPNAVTDILAQFNIFLSDVMGDDGTGNPLLSGGTPVVGSFGAVNNGAAGANFFNSNAFFIAINATAPSGATQILVAKGPSALWSFGPDDQANLAFNTDSIDASMIIIGGYGVGTYGDCEANGATCWFGDGQNALLLAAVPVPFTASPTNGVAPLGVTFTDTSTLAGITNWSWTFGDGGTTNLATNSVFYTYNTPGVYSVTEIVSGLGGSSTNTRANYITAANVPLPSITTAVTASNAALQIGNMIVVVAGHTNTFSVEATTDPDTSPLSYQWLFGDGVTNAWSPSNTVDHAYTTTNCESYQASVTISNGMGGTIASNFTIVVACQLNLGKLAAKLNFAKTNSDSCTVTGSFPLQGTPSFAGKQATLDIGGASLTFTLPSKGKGTAVSGRSTFSTPTFNKKTGWKLNASFKNGFWQTDWANYSMINSNIARPGASVSDLPVILLLNGEAFMATTNLHYTAKQGKSGTAK